MLVRQNMLKNCTDLVSSWLQNGAGTLKAKGKQYILKEGYVFFIGFNSEFEPVASETLQTPVAYCEL